MATVSIQELTIRSQFTELSLAEKRSILLFENDFLSMESSSAGNVDFDTDSVMDQILGYQDISELEDKRVDEEVKKVVSTVGRWSERAADGYGSSYTDIKEILKEIEIQDGDTVVDIGSGYGRVGNVIGTNYPNVKFLGYEIVEQRVTEAQRIAKLLKLNNVNYFQTDFSADEFRFPKADWIFSYNIFEDDIAVKVIKRISEMKKTDEVHFIVKSIGFLRHYAGSPYLKLVCKGGDGGGSLGRFWIYRVK